MNVRLRIQHENRKSLAMRATPDGVVVAIPHGLDQEGAEVQAFIQDGLAKLSQPDPVPEDQRLDRLALRALVNHWAARLAVPVTRVQLRRMRRKWGSMSTRGTLTLARDLTRLPRSLVEYVVVHELLHLVVPRHDRTYAMFLERHLPDWREREAALARWALWLGEQDR